MISKIISITFVLFILPTIGLASDWRVHLSVCNQDPNCAKEQAVARDLWDSQKWTPELKESCRKQYIQTYSKDYKGAVSCVQTLEKQRQEFQAREAYIDRKRREHKTYRSWGGVIIK